MIKYTKYQQGNSITLDELKQHMKIVEDCHDMELVILLKSATLFVQEYFNTTLVECSVLQEQPKAGAEFDIFLTGHTNIQVKDYSGNNVGFVQSGNSLTLPEPTAVRISYDCTPIDNLERYALIVYQVAAANYDGQPELIQKILRNYPVC